MEFQYLKVVSREQAQADYYDALLRQGCAPTTEKISVQDAIGRVTAKAVYAHISAPHYPASAMDGIAVVAKDTFGATETTSVVLSSEQYLVVDTGDPIPPEYDAVIMVEDIARKDDGSVVIYAPATPWQHIRQIGEDICAGEMIVASSIRITPAAIGSMLAGGVLEVEVIKKPIIGIIPTGDEIIPPTDNPKPGDIIEFNSSIFSGIIKEWDAIPKTYPIVLDKFEKIELALRTALKECDIVILNAGSSAGRDDYSTEAIAKVGQVLHHGIAIKPGKPAILGYSGAKPILGVPGYPVSGILIIELFLKPFIENWYNIKSKKTIVNAILAKTINSSLKYEEYVRVRLGKVGDRLMASPLNRGAGVVSSFMKADGMIVVPQNQEGYEAGETVQVELLRPAEDLDKMLIGIGSHDPLLDEIADMMHTADTNIFMNSSHVGSMGGIMAIKRGETHFAGIHLLDEKDGNYNTSFVKKYLPKGGAKLVECVGRTQGLIIQKGNPKNIQGIADLTQKGIRYVNRQKGSGTRILMDYLCNKEGINIDAIYGYDREEFTHTSVAAQIVNDTADAGMGIYSAAHTYDLDFLPICMEQYDLLIPDEAWDTPQVKLLLEILKSDEFKNRLEKLGGYEVKEPGRIREEFPAIEKE